MTITLSEIHIFPIKACAGLAPAAGRGGALGWRRPPLAGNRRHWALAHQRVQPRLALVRAEPVTCGLRLAWLGRTRSRPRRRAPIEALPVTIWRDTVRAVLAGGPAHDWISRALGQPCRLVHMQDTCVRAVNPLMGARARRSALPTAILCC